MYEFSFVDFDDIVNETKEDAYLVGLMGISNTKFSSLLFINVELHEEISWVTVATIKEIQSNLNWWYKGCKGRRHVGGVTLDFEKWYCKKCKNHWPNYVPKFCIQIRVVNESNAASFVIFDKEAMNILKISAPDLRELHIIRGGDLAKYPHELDVLKDKTFLFKVNIKKQNILQLGESSFQVGKVCTDESIIEDFAKKVKANEVCKFCFKLAVIMRLIPRHVIVTDFATPLKRSYAEVEGNGTTDDEDGVQKSKEDEKKTARHRRKSIMLQKRCSSHQSPSTPIQSIPHSAVSSQATPHFNKRTSSGVSNVLNLSGNSCVPHSIFNSNSPQHSISTSNMPNPSDHLPKKTMECSHATPDDGMNSINASRSPSILIQPISNSEVSSQATPPFNKRAFSGVSKVLNFSGNSYLPHSIFNSNSPQHSISTSNIHNLSDHLPKKTMECSHATPDDDINSINASRMDLKMKCQTLLMKVSFKFLIFHNFELNYNRDFECEAETEVSKVQLPLLKYAPDILRNLHSNVDNRSKHFLRNIRAYNMMFCFTSFGGKVDTSINKGSNPPIFRIGGQNHHSMGGLIPLQNQKPKFAQLYIHDTEDEINNRLNCFRMSENYKDAFGICRWAGYPSLFISYNYNLQSEMARELEEGFPHYRRRDDGRTVKKKSIELDNRYVVPYNLKFLLKYQAHINVEYTCQTSAIKYLSKYIHKGNDLVTAAFSHSAPDGDKSRTKDEIQKYYDCRYPHVQRLSFHLPQEKTVIFKNGDSIEDVLKKADAKKLMFEAWMGANKKYEEARNLTYSEFPTKFVYKEYKQEWTQRKKGFAIGRINHVPPGTGEDFYIRISINFQKGYEDIRTINGVEYPSFKDACYCLGLLDDDNEYIDGIKEASFWGFAHYIRRLFANLLLSNSMSRLEFVWESFWKLLSDDILHHQKRVTGRQDLTMSDEEIKNNALAEVEKILHGKGRSLRDYATMPFPSGVLLSEVHNKLIRDELSYDRTSLTELNNKYLSCITVEQKFFYDEIMSTASENKEGFFFLYGFGGTGKTFIWKTL
ncbi:hypothetical protein Dsin_004668 [Dipteronia sinensis]|uniref:ATP-dependent DNA helicase n=1 Tax=Dipteronia sinensis TaxID=43782 RepID=A0AAE0AV06_9ROSI|nr:hypothetical protein Dsin_004668 [Dipteronia sinensis]